MGSSVNIRKGCTENDFDGEIYPSERNRSASARTRSLSTLLWLWNTSY